MYCDYYLSINDTDISTACVLLSLCGSHELVTGDCFIVYLEILYFRMKRSLRCLVKNLQFGNIGCGVLWSLCSHRGC